MTRLLSTTATCLTLTLVMFGFQNCGQKVGFASDSVSQSLDKNAASGAVQPVAEISEPNSSNGSSNQTPAQVSNSNHDDDDHDADHDDEMDSEDHDSKSADSSTCDKKKKSSTDGNEFVRCRLAKKYQYKLGIDPKTKGLAFVTSSADHVCVREETCEALIAKSFNQQTAYDGSKGYCNNSQAVRLTDEQVKTYLAN